MFFFTAQEKFPTGATSGGYDSDDDLLQSALEENLRINASQKPAGPVPNRAQEARPTAVAPKIGTVGALKKDEQPSENRGKVKTLPRARTRGWRFVLLGQAFYAGGSERSGQQIIGPPQGNTNDAQVKNLFDAVRKQGAREGDRDAPSQPKKETPFHGAGRALGDQHMPPQRQGPPSSGAPAGAAATAAPSPPARRAEPLPVRLYSNGFTVGTGELRKFEENKEFMECLKRGEVPPELKNLNKDGSQVEVKLELI